LTAGPCRPPLPAAPNSRARIPAGGSACGQ
jgi:hypothetical protein